MIILLGVGLSAVAQNTTNKGTEFWVTFTSHINVEDGEFYPPGLALYITSDVSTSGTVSIPGTGYSNNFTVSPNNITIVQVPLDRSYVGSSEIPEAKGILVTSGDPVVVFSHIYGEKRSGASLVMPTRSLGQEYRAITYHNTSQFSVIGTEDNTWVEITASAPTEGGKPANTPFKVELQRGEVYQVRAGGDLTGSRITTILPENTSCKKIAVYSGSMGVTMGCGAQGYDNLYQQLFAYSSWGRNYIAVPMENRPYDIIRILAGENNTKVSINGAGHVIPPGRFMEIPQVSGPLVISADQPVCVAQFTPSQACDPRNPFDDQSPFYRPLYPGDPDMVILSPIEQNLTQITLYSSSAQDITANYINVIIGNDDAASFTLDGSSRAGSFSSVPGNPDYSYARFQVSAGTHHLAAEGGFNAIAYGFGNYESYAYLGGTNLLDLAKRITHHTGAEIFSGTESCSGRTVRFSADLDFEVFSFQWDFGDGSLSPVETDQARLLAYEHTYATSGNFTVRLVILKSDGSECGDAEQLEIRYDIEVAPNPAPEPDFSMPASCENDLVLFENLSAIADGTEMTYRWDFGDGSPEQAGENPAHRFPGPGAYRVTLYATSKYGCRQQITREVIINASDPLAGFRFTDNICQK
ncbi:MAG TPA: PKD domain-containing protein, partial [Anseongella sp.]|nr:PKD domain-containing protein [Anseongella sp.]